MNKYAKEKLRLGMFKVVDSYRFDRGGKFGDYRKSRNCFVTRKFELNMTTCEAWSYDWWQFVIKVGNTIYFNDASYSMQTRQHQRLAQNIIDAECPEQFGIRVKYVYYREGLNHLDTAIRNMQFNIQQLKEAINKPRSHRKTNKSRRERIVELKQEIKDTRKLMRVLNKQRRLNAEVRRKLDDEQYERARMKYMSIRRARFWNTPPNASVVRL